MKVSIFGTGYVGLVQGAILASVGHEVICVDVDLDKINSLKEGIITIFEPGLSSIVKKNISNGRLTFTTDAELAVNHGEFQFIAVGTPPDEDGFADLQYVLSVAETIATHMTDSKLIVNKSTVPVGTADSVRSTVKSILLARGVDLYFDVISNPEFLKEGNAVVDCMKPERIIIGTSDESSCSKMRELYSAFSRNHEKIIVMDTRSAELTKYAANCMLATKISFMNEMSNIAEKVGADIEAVRQGMGSDSRIGYQFIYPGCGYGGSCFPKDVRALIRTSRGIGYTPKILEAVESTNNAQKNKLFTYLNKYFNDKLHGRTIAIWGLSFKPNTDDMREASSLVLIKSLLQEGAKVKAYDPESMEECRRILYDNNLILTESKEEAVIDADALVICTEWSQFRAPDFDFLISNLYEKLIVDGRNMYDPKLMSEKGFLYYGIGRGLSIDF
ncbi:UDP-glucose/GDP-mannose dehydrogenase family protein [Pseudomonadales bacterium]|nr:UDP-glucose/GDP-mannose dehydrogenase family protein [Pseudomonadales bacterium]